MNSNIFISGGIIATTIGFLLLMYSGGQLYLTGRRIDLMIASPAFNVNTKVFEVDKGGRFHWIEFSVGVSYEYIAFNKKYFGEKVYFDGEVSYKNKHDADMIAVEFNKIDKIYFDPRNQKISSIYCDVAPSLRAHFHGVLAAGLLVTLIGLVFFFF